jgi:hypothetical protein
MRCCQHAGGVPAIGLWGGAVPVKPYVQWPITPVFDAGLQGEGSAAMHRLCPSGEGAASPAWRAA